VTARNPLEQRSQAALLTVIQPPPPGTLTATYWWPDAGGRERYYVKVRFVGRLVSAEGPDGATAFDKTITQEVWPTYFGDAKAASAKITDLRPGTWSIDAYPSCCGRPVERCEARVTGWVSLSVVETMPRCN
jgi:hypothetical protein